MLTKSNYIQRSEKNRAHFQIFSHENEANAMSWQVSAWRSGKRTTNKRKMKMNFNRSSNLVYICWTLIIGNATWKTPHLAAVHININAVSIHRKLKGTEERKNTNWRGTKRKNEWTTQKKNTSKKKKIFRFQLNEENRTPYTVHCHNVYWNIYKSWRHWFEFVSCRESELRNSYSGETEQIIL